VDARDPRVGQCLDGLHDGRVPCRKRIEDDFRQERRIVRDVPALPGEGSADFRDHVGRIEEPRCIRIDQRDAAGPARGLLDQNRPIVLGTGAAPFVPATLQDPHAGDVLQKAERPPGAAFVGEIGGEDLLADERRVAFHADQRPGAG
jgi:hypothetical protein